MLSFLKSFGSGISANYNINSHPSFSTGGWKVYDAKSRTTKELVSVFVLDKRDLSETLTRNGFRHKSKIVTEISEHFAKEVQQLTRMRHPSLLRIIVPLESGSRNLTFVTERVTASLTLLLRTREEMDDLAVIRGATLIVDALRFLHDELNLVHMNLTPETVLIDANGDWKLRGLSFAQPYTDFEPGQFHLPQDDPRLPGYMHPPVDFLAPEVVLKNTISPASDVWSLSCVLYTIYYGEPPLHTRGNLSNYNEEFDLFHRKVDRSQLAKLPKALQPYTQAMFATEPSGRITLPTLLSTDYFDSPLVKALKKMDEYATMDVNDRVSFLKYLSTTLLPQFPKSIKVRKILAFAIGELDGPRQEPTGLLLSNLMFAAATDMSKLTFSERILPVFAKLSDWHPFQQSTADNLAVIVQDTSEKDFTHKVLPVLVDTLKANDNAHAQAQCSIMLKSDIFVGHINVSKLEQQLFPAVVNLFSATPSKSVKIACAKSCQTIVEKGLSKSLIISDLIPALESMKTRDSAVVVAVATLWDVCTSKLSSQSIIEHSIPQILQLSMAPGLTVAQYKTLLQSVRRQLNDVEKEQVLTLQHNTESGMVEEDWITSPPLNGDASFNSPDSAAQGSHPMSSQPKPQTGVSNMSSSLKPSQNLPASRESAHASSKTSASGSQNAKSRGSFSMAPNNSEQSNPPKMGSLPILMPTMLDSTVKSSSHLDSSRPTSSAPMQSLQPISLTNPSPLSNMPALQPLRASNDHTYSDDFGDFTSGTAAGDSLI